MKKKYFSPVSERIALVSGRHFLAGSGSESRYSVSSYSEGESQTFGDTED